jgi:hypothetical protein
LVQRSVIGDTPSIRDRWDLVGVLPNRIFMHPHSFDHIIRE